LAGFSHRRSHMCSYLSRGISNRLLISSGITYRLLPIGLA
jgi:hypothetical protein